jgi:hypothetical protein
MNIKLLVDQKRALQAGIDAPHSTVILDVHPGELSGQERQVIAAVMEDGHDCTKRRIRLEDDGTFARSHASGAPQLTLTRPDQAGLHDAITELVTVLRGDRTTRMAERRKSEAYADKTIDQAIAEGRTETCWYWLDDQGGLVTNKHATTSYALALELPKKPCVWTGSASDEGKQRLEAAKKKIEEERKRVIEAALPALRDARAEYDKRQEQERTDYEIVYEQLPAKLRERHAAGFATDYEVEDAMRALLLKGVKLGALGDELTHQDWDEKEELGALNDFEFTQYKLVQHYRKADEDDEDISIDSDGEVLVDGERRRVLLIEWTLGGLNIQGEVDLREAQLV